MTKRARGLLAVAAILAVAGAAVALWPKRKPKAPALDEDPVVLVQFVSTEAFKELPPSKKAEYVDVLSKQMLTLFRLFNEGKISKEQQQKAFENAAQVWMNSRLDEYYAKPVGRERAEYLDQLIDEGERMRKAAMLMRAATRPLAFFRPATQRAADEVSPEEQEKRDRDAARREWQSPARIKKFIEDTPPAKRTQMAQFVADMVQRRKERGMTGDPHDRR